MNALIYLQQLVLTQAKSILIIIILTAVGIGVGGYAIQTHSKPLEIESDISVTPITPTSGQNLETTVTKEPTLSPSEKPNKVVKRPTLALVPTTTTIQAQIDVDNKTSLVNVGTSVRMCKEEKAGQIQTANNNTNVLSQLYINCLAEHGIEKGNCLGRCSDWYSEKLSGGADANEINPQYESCRSSCLAPMGEVVCAPKKELYDSSQLRLNSLVQEHCE